MTIRDDYDFARASARKLGLTLEDMRINIDAKAAALGRRVADAIKRGNVADDGALARLFDEANKTRELRKLLIADIMSGAT